MTSNQVQNSKISEKILKKPQSGTQVTVMNNTSSVMKFVKSVEWSGSPASPGYPACIQPDYPGLFTHLGNVNFGSRAAVVYSGSNLLMQSCSWVLAWDAPAYYTTQSPNKVFVACGPKSVIDIMPDDQIRMFLENSSHFGDASDLPSKTDANATINDNNLPFTATVVAGFSHLPKTVVRFTLCVD